MRRTNVFKGDTCVNLVNEDCEIILYTLNLKERQYRGVNYVGTYGEILTQTFELVANPMIVAFASPSLLELL